MVSLLKLAEITEVFSYSRYFDNKDSRQILKFDY